MNTILKEHKKTSIRNLIDVFLWRRHPDLNRGIKVLQTSALPLGYSATLVARAGIEPATRGFSVLCSTD